VRHEETAAFAALFTLKAVLSGAATKSSIWQRSICSGRHPSLCQPLGRSGCASRYKAGSYGRPAGVCARSGLIQAPAVRGGTILADGLAPNTPRTPAEAMSCGGLVPAQRRSAM
jgi:hypothetical protein